MIEDLRAKFLRRCEEDLAVARDGAEHPAFRLVVHRLAGVAPMFGFEALGRVAVEIDDALNEGREATTEQVANLRQALERALGQTP